MNASPKLTDKQNEALDTLVDLFRRSRKNDPDAQTAFLGAALLLAQQSVLDYLVAALLTQAQMLNIPPTKSLLFKDMAFEIEAVMHEKKQGMPPGSRRWTLPRGVFPRHSLSLLRLAS
jgi:hypothetical protein